MAKEGWTADVLPSAKGEGGKEGDGPAFNTRRGEDKDWGWEKMGAPSRLESR